MAADIADLVRALNYFHPMSPLSVAFFQKHIVEVSCHRGELLLEKGKVCDYIYFVQQGLLRGFIVDRGRDITTWISCENELVTCIDSLDTQDPSMENIEAIEDCRLLALSNENLQRLYDLHPEFNIVARKLIQQYYRDAEKRAFIARLTTAEEKYKLFLQQYSHLANRVFLKYIASFLGITLETLSRVRGKMSAKKSALSSTIP